MKTSQNRRILLVDDMPAIHQDFRKILAPQAQEHDDLGAMEAALFANEGSRAPALIAFELDSAYQGLEGLHKLDASLRDNRPYAVAFVDMRMPPGWDGVETIEHLWRCDPRLQVVICTAYADGAWADILARLDVRDRLLILKKPFDPIEVFQLAAALTTKWQMTEDAEAQRARLEEAVQERTHELSAANEALRNEMRERQHLEGQLVQSEKMASIGQLAAGVAHEINNPIGYIFSNYGTLEGYIGQLFELITAYEQAESSVESADVRTRLRSLRERLEWDFLKEDIPVLIRESKQGIVRVRQIVQDLKDFSRVDSQQQWEWADLHQGIESTLNIVASEVRYKADLVKEYGTLPPVECMASQINQVVMNLVVNAAHAMGDKHGRITLRTGYEGANAWMEVADNGCGMPPETLKRIFEPFFTTKPIGKGTGLGLSLSYGIVEKHHGRIEVHSVVGQGTTFRVTLPIRQEQPQAPDLPLPQGDGPLPAAPTSTTP